MAGKNELLQIKDNVDSIVGKRIKLKANRGRRKTFEKEGILEKTYPNIFIVKLDDQDQEGRRVSYSYSDILTQTVEIAVYSDDGFYKMKWAG